MIGLDTNVLVRYIMQDDPQQSPKANQLIESLDGDNTGYITIVTIVELYWVLTSAYKLTRQQAGQAIEAILCTKYFLVERADQVMRALRVFGNGNGKADFPDCLIERSASSAGCKRTMTFDVGAARHAGMILID